MTRDRGGGARQKSVSFVCAPTVLVHIDSSFCEHFGDEWSDDSTRLRERITKSGVGDELQSLVCSEIIWSVALERLSAENACAILVWPEWLKMGGSRADFGDMITNAVWVVDSLIMEEGSFMEENERKSAGDDEHTRRHFERERKALSILIEGARHRVAELVYRLASADPSYLDRRKLLTRLDLGLLQRSTLVPQSEKQSKVLLIRRKTNLLYKQHRFNLVREATGGYAHLLSRLRSDVSSITKEELQALVGVSSIDPNRVLDFVLNWFETSSHTDAECEWIFNCFEEFRDRIPWLVGIRFVKEAEATRMTPSLFTFAAMLIRRGVISLEQLWPYLSPGDDSMLKEFANSSQEAIKRACSLGIVTLNPSAAASTLPSSSGGTTTSGSSVASQTETPEAISFADVLVPSERERADERTNQKLAMAVAIAQNGDWPDLFDVLTRVRPSGLIRYESLTRAVCAFLTARLDNFFADSSPLFCTNGQRWWREKTNDVAPSGGAITSIAEFFAKALPLANRLGPYLCRDPRLVSRFCRFLHFVLGEDVSKTQRASEEPIAGSSLSLVEAQRTRVEKFVTRVLLPCLSLLPSNVALSAEIWGHVLIFFSYDVRYDFYDSWRGSLEESGKRSDEDLNAPLRLVRAIAVRDVKRLLRRISKDTVRTIGKELCKLSHRCPFVVFDQMLTQIEAYPNLSPFLIESMKNVSPLGWDVLTYAIVQHLSPIFLLRPKIKEDGTNVSSWLQSISSFAGLLYRRHPISRQGGSKNGVVTNAEPDLTGLLDFVATQLQDTDEKAVDLLVLDELMAKMAGIEVTEELTVHQLRCLAGGENLRQEAYPGTVKRMRRPAERLRDAIGRAGYTIPFLVIIAQHLSSLAYHARGIPHLKMIAHLVDECHHVLLQYSEFLSIHLGAKQYAELLPSFSVLCDRLRVSPPIAFFLVRPVLHSLNEKGTILYETSRIREKDKGKGLQKNATTGKDFEMDTGEPGELGSNAEGEREGHVMEGFRIAVHDISPELWSRMSLDLYISFWSLSLYDISIPVDAYEEERRKLRTQLKELDRTPELPSDAAKRRKQRDRFTAAIDRLNAEESEQKHHTTAVRKWLMNEKGSWGSDEAAGSDDLVRSFFHSCIVPRCDFSSEDALFCAEFLLLLHEFKIPGFSVLGCIDLIMRGMRSRVFQVTQNQSSRLGRMLNRLLELLFRWKSGAGAAFPSDVSMPRTCLNLVGAANEKTQKKGSFASFDEFCALIDVWERHLLRDLNECLVSGEFMSVRNGLSVLIQIATVFPFTRSHSAFLEQSVQGVKDEDDREDVKLIATRYLTMLQQRAKSLPDVHKSVAKSSATSPGRTSATSTDTSVTEKAATASVAMNVDETPPTSSRKGELSRNAEVFVPSPDLRSPRGAVAADSSSSRSLRSRDPDDRDRERSGLRKRHRSESPVPVPEAKRQARSVIDDTEVMVPVSGLREVGSGDAKGVDQRRKSGERWASRKQRRDDESPKAAAAAKAPAAETKATKKPVDDGWDLPPSMISKSSEVHNESDTAEHKEKEKLEENNSVEEVQEAPEQKPVSAEGGGEKPSLPENEKDEKKGKRRDRRAESSREGENDTERERKLARRDKRKSRDGRKEEKVLKDAKEKETSVTTVVEEVHEKVAEEERKEARRIERFSGKDSSAEKAAIPNGSVESRDEGRETVTRHVELVRKSDDPPARSGPSRWSEAPARVIRRVEEVKSQVTPPKRRRIDRSGVGK